MAKKPAKQPSGGHPSLGREINRAGKSMRALLEGRLQAAGTNYATWTVLFILDGMGPLIQRELAEQLEVEGPTLVRRLDQLEREGLVVRNENPGDRRSSRVAITEAGRAMFKRVRSYVSEAEGEVLRGFSAHEISRTREILQKLTANCRALTKQRG